MTKVAQYTKHDAAWLRAMKIDPDIAPVFRVDELQALNRQLREDLAASEEELSVLRTRSAEQRQVNDALIAAVGDLSREKRRLVRERNWALWAGYFAVLVLMVVGVVRIFA